MVVVGACIGVDAEVARAAKGRGDLHVHTIVPANRALVDPEWERYTDTYEIMPKGSSYKDRDERIVQHSARLIAIPAYPEDHPYSKRSGTWLTVRIARRYHRPVEEYVLRSPANGVS